MLVNMTIEVQIDKYTGLISYNDNPNNDKTIIEIPYAAKLLWHEIYTHIVDIIEQYKTHQVIVCKNFHKINNDLLKVFYSYIQDSRQYSVNFILKM